MVKITPKSTIRITMHGACTTHARTDVTVRDQSLTIDEPEERGGTNAGTTPVETYLAALVACTNRITRKVAAAHGVEIKDMSVDLEADFDRRGALLEKEVDLPFPAVTLKIALTTDADAAAIEKVKADLPRFCPISKAVRASGTRLVAEWTVNRP